MNFWPAKLIIRILKSSDVLRSPFLTTGTIPEPLLLTYSNSKKHSHSRIRRVETGLVQIVFRYSIRNLKSTNINRKLTFQPKDIHLPSVCNRPADSKNRPSSHPVLAEAAVVEHFLTLVRAAPAEIFVVLALPMSIQIQ